MSGVTIDLARTTQTVDLVVSGGPTLELVRTTSVVDLIVPTATVVINPNAGSFYEHQQATPATVWTINHNLGKHPSITVLDSISRMVIGFDVVYSTLNSLTITFSAAFSGTAYLN